MVEFRKQPVSPPPGSDSEVVSSDGGHNPHPISLLSSLLSEHSPTKTASATTTSAAASGYVSGPSAPSSSPSTAFSSPRAHDPISILRRGSIGSDAEPFHLNCNTGLGFARVSTLSTPTSPAIVAKEPPQKDKQPPAILLHEPPKQAAADVTATKTTTASARRPSLKFTVAQPRPFVERIPVQAASDDESTHTDPGYEEDSEDGFSDDDDEPSFIMQAMARARESRLRNAQPRLPVRPASASPPPSAAVPPPPRRGRGHIRVDPAADKDHQQCSRHHSPPPSDARSTPPPGPRDGRAGSPVPSHHSDEDEDDDDDDEDDEENTNENENDDKENDEIEDNEEDMTPQPPRPDDNALMSDSDDAAPFGISAGVRNILRRASEHLPGFRRPSFNVTALADEGSPAQGSPDKTVPIGRSRSLSARMPSAALRMANLEDRAAATVAMSGAAATGVSVASRPVNCPSPNLKRKVEL